MLTILCFVVRYWFFPITNYQLPITYYLLPITNLGDSISIQANMT
ncbi:hypothetical protein [Fischerella thermalis]